MEILPKSLTSLLQRSADWGRVILRIYVKLGRLLIFPTRMKTNRTILCHLFGEYITLFLKSQENCNNNIIVILKIINHLTNFRKTKS